MNNLKEQFNSIEKLKYFEVPVIDNRTNENEYILFDISLQKNTLVAQHESLTAKQSKSKKIAYVSEVLNNYFTIDENLQNLYDKCINAILFSEYFTLND
jgi:hypothetical protein